MSDYKRESGKPSHYPEPITVFLPPKKSTVKLWIKGKNKWWNPENKVEYP